MGCSSERMIFTKLTTDGFILFGSRILRMFAYGFLSVVLVLYLSKLGLNEFVIGFLISATLIGDAAISFWMTTNADRIGRRRILVAGAGLMLLASALFAGTDKVALLLVAATVGVISPSGYEVGPFLSVEQAALSEIVSDETRTEVFGWYNLGGSFATAAGALTGGGLTQVLQRFGVIPLNSYRTVVVLYGLIGIVMGLLFTRLSAAVEAAHLSSPQIRSRFGLHRSTGVVLKLSALFGLDAFAGGFVLQSIVAYWFHVRFGVEPAVLGGDFLRSEYPRWNFCFERGMGGETDRPGEYDGVHASPFERPPDACAAYAEPSAGSLSFARPFQHLPDGRATAPILHHGSGHAR